MENNKLWKYPPISLLKEVFPPIKTDDTFNVSKMLLNKKIFIPLILITAVGLLVYQFGKQRSTSINENPKQENAVMVNEAKGVCEEKLEKQQDISVNEKFEGNPKLVNFTSFPEAKTYYTFITNAAVSGPNFAGHFTIASWGCGTDCFGYAVIDTKTGRIIDYSPANGNYHLGKFSLSSRIMVFEPVYKGQERKFYQVVEDQDGKSKLELVCSEISSEDMFNFPE